MRKQRVFLLLVSGALSFGTLCTALHQTSLPHQDCTSKNDSTSAFLTCVGVPSHPGGAVEQQIVSLKALLDALLDVVVFLDSGLRDIPLMNVSAGWSINSTALWQDDDFIRTWLQIRLTPLLTTISQNFLTCLGYTNFSCQTYQIVVQELSQQFSSLDPQKQQWIYSYFMQPFLSNNAPKGCVLPGDSTEDWLMKNFGSFSVLAQIRDFSSINGFFNGLDVLHVLSPVQKAALMLYPESGGLNSTSLSVVLSSLMRSLTPSAGDLNTSNGSLWNAGFPLLYLSSPQDALTQTVNSFMTAFRPVGSFVQEFVSLTHQRDVSSMRSATLLQAMLNWTLAELAAPYKNISTDQTTDQTPFSPTDVNSWFKHVVIPVLNQFLYDIPAELTAVFHDVFYLENSVNTSQDTCAVTLDGVCAVANVMEHVAKLLQCAAITNLTLTDKTLTSLTLHLSNNLNTLLNQLAHTNFTSEDSPFRDLLDRIHDRTHTDLRDEVFVTMWFYIKLKPLLPKLTPDYLLCLSAKAFSCRTFQILVQEMSNHMFLMPENTSRAVYENFITPFLFQQNSTGACMRNSSSEWILMNLGGFFRLATVQRMFLLNPRFDALEALTALTLNQTAEIIVEDLTRLPDKEQLIDVVFSNMLTSESRRRQLPQLVLLVSHIDTMKENCLIYKHMFLWLHFASLSANPETEAVILSSIDNLRKTTPAVCVSYSGGCEVTAVNGSRLCDSVNSSALLEYLNTTHNGSKLCSFNITQYSCAELNGLSAADLATVLFCNLNSNITESDETWKLFLLRVSSALGPALDLITNTSFQQSLSVGVVLDVISDVSFSTFSSSSFTNYSFVQLWFGKRLRPFLPHTSHNFLSCLSKNNFSCETYQNVVQIFSEQFDVMSIQTRMSVYVYFIHTFLNLNQNAGCSVGVPSSDWLTQNFGTFAVFATLTELQSLNRNLSVMDILDSLSVTQLVEVSSSPDLVSTPAHVSQVMKNVPDSELGLFFTKFSSTLTVSVVSLTREVSGAFLQQVFERVDLGNPVLPDFEVDQWISIRLPPFISNIQTSQIPLFFSMITQRSCNLSLAGVALLNSTKSNLTTDILQTINQQLIISLKEPLLMNCYSIQSYYSFLKSYFMSFQFPSLSTFLSLMPPGRMSELLNSMSPAELSEYLNLNKTVDQQTKLCELFDIYNQTESYLQSAPVGSSSLARQTLKCVWPRALNASSQADVERWFNVILVRYLPFLSTQMISSTQMSGASCFTFSKFVSVMGDFNIDKANFTKQDIYTTIQSFLTTEDPPKCYDPLDATLNSTAWFHHYIGAFITFISKDDLQQFGGFKLQQFTPDTQNLQLFRYNNVSHDVITVYTNMLFDAEPNFSVLLLPQSFWCSAPSSAFLKLSQSDAVNISNFLQQQCTNIDPTVSAALVSNVATLTPDTIKALGNSITGLSVGQITSCSPSTLLSSLTLLSSVHSWSQGQAIAIVQSLLSTGEFKITSVESLQQLGSLLMGVPSTWFSSISAESLLTALQSHAFLSNVITTPITTQHIIVNQIISVNSSSDIVVQNVPESLTPLIPRPFLLFLSQQSATALNEKRWSHDQAKLLFHAVAAEIPNADNISFQVLQGFTCSHVQTFSSVKVKDLIRGCRRRANTKINLHESQLTCMYNYIKRDSASVFSDYPADMLLYYNLSQVQPSQCESYYSALGNADFSVLSSTLAFRRNFLFTNARQCLGVSGWSVNPTQLDVMGQMVCVFNSTFIHNSHSYLLEKLKVCESLSGEQSSAVESVLLSGNTVYGAPASWNESTLTALEDLPLYLTSTFWAYFTQNEKVRFLRRFVPGLKSRGVSRERIFTLIAEAGKESRSSTRSLLRLKRDTACMVGEITQVQVSDASFPFGYDANQFNACLSARTLKDNLKAITDKAAGRDYQKIILDKLKQLYTDTISDQVLQLLGPSSRSASANDIRKWNVTTIDTLAALMKTYDGDWSPEQVRAIVSRYLSDNRTLGSLELNILGGVNLCALNTTILKSISCNSLQFADALSVSHCSVEQKKLLFNIALLSYSHQTLRTTNATVSLDSYHLIQTYLGGANLSYVRTLSISNISMDLLTFITLDQNVINDLTVHEVRGLLGVNVPDLKTYESNAVIHSWITRQLQSDLDTLGVGLTGGRLGPVTTTAKATTSTNANTTATTTVSTNATAATTSKSTGAGWRVSASSGLHKLLLLLAVTMATLQLH